MLLHLLFLTTMMTMALSAAIGYDGNSSRFPSDDGTSSRFPSDYSASSQYTSHDSFPEVSSHITAEAYSFSTEEAVESSSKNPVEDKLAELQEEIRSLSASIKDLSNENAEYFQLIFRNADNNVDKIEKIIQKNINNLEDNLYNNTDILKRILQALDRPERIVTLHDSSTAEYDEISASEPSQPLPSSSEALPPSTTTEEPLPDKDCADLYLKGQTANGKYLITPLTDQESFDVYCDMETDGGGWTVIQRRGDYGNRRDYFYRSWNEYKNGFGNVDNEFWLGNDRLFALTQQKPQLLRVDLWDKDNNQVHAQYSKFKVENEQHFYRLHVSGYSGKAGNSLLYSNEAPFTTKDRDNDQDSGNCAVKHQGAWWYKSCTYSNLNGLNLGGFSDSSKGIWWFHWKASYLTMTSTEMKIRPANF